MRKVPQFLLRSIIVASMPVAAHAAGTYYTGGYQSPQTNYGARTTGNYSQYSTYTRTTGYQPGNNAYRGNGAANYNRGNGQGAAQQNAQARPAQKASSGKSGFYIDAGIAHEYAVWQFDMNESGSLLHYDNLAWNTLNINGGYVFDMGNTKVQIDAGLKYGLQSGESYMVDDDITNGGYLIASIVKDDNSVIGNQVGHAMSIGTTKDGDMLGFNIGVGLTDIFQWGNVKMTPSIGYRYFKYKLTTSSNYGLAVDTAACFITEDGETQCDPIVVFVDGDGNKSVVWRENFKLAPEVPADSVYYETEGTFYFEQPGTSHSYEVDWSGPYIAMDMQYDINQNNAVTGRVELGFPGYTSTGDQPYRFDWAHPKSVEDSAGMFSALHLGLGANWMTAINDKIMLTIGLTYDYYTVSDVDAKTYLNSGYYNDLYASLEDAWQEKYGNLDNFLDSKEGNQTAIAINDLKNDCPGWVCSLGGEVNSFYRSLGVRVGINAKF